MVAVWQLFLEVVCGLLFTAPIQVGITSILGGIGSAVVNFLHEACGSLIGSLGA